MNIKQYQELYRVLSQDLPELDKACYYYGIMKGMDYEDVCEKIPVAKVLKFYSKFKGIQKKPFFGIYRIGWKFYRIKLDITNNTVDENVSIQSLASNQDETINNLHLILATMTKRKNKSAKYLNQLADKIQKNVSIGMAYSLTVFFLKVYSRENLLKHLTTRLQKVNKELETILQNNG